jgi:3-methylfumaryl-CoA hydratase
MGEPSSRLRTVQPSSKVWSARWNEPPAEAPEDLVDMIRDFDPAPVVTEDVLDPWRAEALAGVLGADPPATGEGDPLPLGWHEVYFRDPLARGGLAEDGHPADHALMPPRRPRRRVFGGAALRQLGPLRLGDEVVKTGTLQDCRIRGGRTGWLLLLTEVHEYAVGGVTALTERRQVVLRHDGPQGPRVATPSPAPADDRAPTAEITFRPDPVTLFRFSALTYNPHRIHYDHRYATGVEGHADLLVHGPLTALTLLEVARRAGGPALTEYEYRLLAPAYVARDLRLLGTREQGGWTLTGLQEGRQVISATAR